MAVILAAGVGRRLSSLAGGRPKALLDVEGTSLLERSVHALAGAGFGECVVVTGYRAEMVDAFVAAGSWPLALRTRLNPDFATTNNIVSLLAAADLLSDGFCLLNSDIIFDAAILADLGRQTDGSWLAVDQDEPLGEEEMKVRLDAHGRLERISKQLPPAESAGEYIGLARFDGAGAGAVVDAARELVDAGRTDLYYEDAIDRAAPRLGARIVPTSGRLWTEVDDGRDYERAISVAARLSPVAQR